MNLLYPYGKDNLCILSDDTYKNLAIDELVQMIAVPVSLLESYFG